MMAFDFSPLKDRQINKKLRYKRANQFSTTHFESELAAEDFIMKLFTVALLVTFVFGVAVSEDNQTMALVRI